MGRTAKVTISLPEELVQLADRLARERKTSRSQVFQACLQDIARQKFEADLAEGYRAMAEEHKEFAERAIRIAHEVLPEWK